MHGDAKQAVPLLAAQPVTGSGNHARAVRAEPLAHVSKEHRYAVKMFHEGPREALRNMAMHCSGVKQAPAAGKSLDGSHLSGLALIGIPAEVYAPPAQPWWRRLLG